MISLKTELEKQLKFSSRNLVTKLVKDDCMNGEEMKKLRQDIHECRLCDLWKTRNNPVVGEGSLTAGVMFIGEAPGYNEDQQGKPFVGRAGKIFDELLSSIELKRKDIYITNILKCRPPGNANPSPEQIKACLPYLDRQIKIIQPNVISTLGNFALSYIFDKFGLKQEKISSVHGRIFTVSNLIGAKKIIPLYHPAAATYNPEMKGLLLEDFKLIRDCL